MTRGQQEAYVFLYAAAGLGIAYAVHRYRTPEAERRKPAWVPALLGTVGGAAVGVLTLGVANRAYDKLD